jgi:hypothetical protein
MCAVIFAAVWFKLEWVLVFDASAKWIGEDTGMEGNMGEEKVSRKFFLWVQHVVTMGKLTLLLLLLYENG